ncbi:hypothetical protein Dsin_028469 [Dipteronia sinensis]|uniref:Uncharacterized protein n=1 Tax=Dipteronia sinensis TaxID=43782 RepID=A0AAD9ZQG3_9ROSI|nr:hypothetical protein Dsin_028469 [Dipteronia sinensis]
MESLHIARMLSCKACPILPKLGPSLGFRPLRQVGFGSLWRNQTQYGCLMARSSTGVGGGSSNQERSSYVENEKEEGRGLPLGPQGPRPPLIGFNAIPPYETGKSEVSESKQENVGDIIKNQLLDNQLNEIKVELRKNNEEIKKLQETVQKSWERVRTEVVKSFGDHAASIFKKAAQDLLEIKRKEEAQQLNTTTSDEGTVFHPGKRRRH